MTRSPAAGTDREAGLGGGLSPGSASIPAPPAGGVDGTPAAGSRLTVLRYRLAAPDVARAIWAGSVARPATLTACVLASLLAIGLLVADGVWRLFGLMLVLVILGAPVLLWREAVRVARLHPAVVADAELLHSEDGLRAPAWGDPVWLPWSAIRHWHVRGALLVLELESDAGLLLLPASALAPGGSDSLACRLSATRPRP